MKFSAQDFREDVLHSDAVVEDEMVEQGRWTTLHRTVFRFDGKFWQAHYEVPSTENSGDFEDVNYNEITAHEVEPYDVTVTRYRRVRS